MSLVDVQLRGVSERDIDHLLIEELAASHDFQRWFGSRIGLQLPIVLEIAARSVLSSTGESDLELVFTTAAGRVLVLLENKIDAALQPRQAERYVERARTRLQQGEFERVLTVLVAPIRYAEGTLGFGSRITYEDIFEHLLERDAHDPRSQYKLQLLDVAINRAMTGWVSVPNERTTAFWRRYWELSSKQAPELRMPRPGKKPSMSGFIRFKPSQLSKGVTLLHKVQYGRVDLQLAGRATELESFSERFGSKLDPGISIVPAAKSLAFRREVAPLSLDAELESSVPTIQAAISAAQDLMRWHDRVLASEIAL